MATSRAGNSSQPQGQWSRRSEKVAGSVARQMVRDIAESGLAPGTTLEAESAMLQRYQVSRASLREALRILEIQGLIGIKPGPGGGPFVRSVESAEFGRTATMYFQVLGVRFSELVESRLILEPVMAGLAAARRNKAECEALQGIVDEGWEASSEAEWIEASDAFHAQVLSMSGNNLLKLVAKSMKDIYTERVAELVFPGGNESKRVRQAHQDIADAIVDGDAETAERLMREHMEEFAAQVSKKMPSLMDEVVDWR